MHPPPPSLHLQGVVQYCWEVVPAYVFIEHQVVDLEDARKEVGTRSQNLQFGVVVSQCPQLH